MQAHHAHEGALKQNIILTKNEKYLIAQGDYLDCIDHRFDEVKRDHKKFHQIIYSPMGDKLCAIQYNELSKIINGGGLDYDQFV